jgi:hypothetical protein
MKTAKAEWKHSREDHETIQATKRKVVQYMNTIKGSIVGYNLKKSVALAKDWLTAQGIKNELHDDILTPFTIKQIQFKKKGPVAPKKQETWQDVLNNWP